MVVSRATWTTEGGLFGDQRVVVSRLASVSTVQFSQSVEVKSFGEVPVPLLLVKVSTAGGVRTLESRKLLLLNLATDQFSKFSPDRYTDTHTHTLKPKICTEATRGTCSKAMPQQAQC